MEVIAKIETDFKTKFGLPRQSGTTSLVGRIVFKKEYSMPEAFRGIEGFSHLWIIWGFSENKDVPFSPTVRPPRLGGNTRMGVFATRSPYRPNKIGLSSVKLIKVEETKENGTVLYVSGIDMVNGTPIYDIKPYIPYTDCKTDAKGGFADDFKDYSLEVKISDELLKKLKSGEKEPLIEVLSQDPRPSYQEDGRIYGFLYANYEIKFFVEEKVLTVVLIEIAE